MRAMTYDEAPAGNAGLRDGTLDNNVLMTGREGRSDNYTLGMTRVVGGYAVPRHRHNFEQLRYLHAGSTNFGEKILLPGWLAYFPEGGYYGPQQRPDGSTTFTFQFGGPSGYGYLSRKQQKAARQELETKGKFEKGYYTYVDASGQRHNQDAFEAVWQHYSGQKVNYIEPRYKDIIVMNSASFDWVEDRDARGVSYKWCGTFNERGTRAGFIRVEKGASLVRGLHDASESLAVIKGALENGGKIYPLYSAFGFDPAEGPTSFVAKETTELLCLQLPRFDD